MDIRVSADGAKHPQGLDAKPHYGSLFVSDTSGITTAGTSAEVLTSAVVSGGSTLTAGECYGITATLATGRLTIARAGIYRIALTAHVLAGNAGICTLEVLKNGAEFSSSASALGGDVIGILKMQAAAATETLVIAPVLRKLAVGDYLTIRATGSVTSLNSKELNLTVEQVTG